VDPRYVVEAPTEVVATFDPANMARGSRPPLDLIVAAGLALLTMPVILLGWNHTFAGIVLGVPFVLLLPGYALAEVLKPDRSRSFSERLLFSLGLSLVVAILGGFLLNLTPWGLQGPSWAVFLGIVTIGGAGFAAWRRLRIGVDLRPILPWSFAIWQIALMAILALFVAASLGVSVAGAMHQPYPGHTELWILPGTATGTGATARIGVKNDETTTTTYSLVVTENGLTVQSVLSITLNVGQSWQMGVSVPAVKTRTALTVTLYRADQPTTPYRSVQLWLGVGNG
jgi:uncharacterized membrane protein